MRPIRLATLLNLGLTISVLTISLPKPRRGIATSNNRSGY